ncbi:hypothetical protein F4776DRAFT_663573 [Hypoxylon sp. NC0597]|nr:hypothetical protein F4776DRAFT_663573 [Hypoxylon sp. NC0597]
MPKFIGSASYELGISKDKIEKLRDQNRQLEARVLFLESYIKKNNLPVPKSRPSQRATGSVTSDKDFSTPTTSSLNRSVQGAPREEQQTLISIRSEGIHRRFQYQDGSLLEISRTTYITSNIDFRRFRRSTLSSDMKRRNKILKVDPKKDKSNTRRDKGYVGGWHEPTTNFVSHWPEDETDIENGSPAEAAKRSLIERSRLEDDVQDYLMRVPIRSRPLFNYLQLALRLAQEIFFHGTKKYFPRVFMAAEPQEVGCGRFESMTSFLNRIEAYGNKIAGIKYDRWDLQQAVDNIINLRNEVCHYSGPWGGFAHYCKFLKSVQNLAVIFGDERRAFKARAYRDKLIEHAEESLRCFDTIGLLTQLPLPKRWDWKTMRLYKEIDKVRYHDGDPVDKLHPTFFKAMRDWGLERPWYHYLD